MGKEIIRVPPNFCHPTDDGGQLVPGAHLALLHSMPPEKLTHFQLYETTSEGTPVSPIFANEDDLDRWFVAQRRSSCAEGGNMVRRDIPGIHGAKGREFMYLESPEDETFRMLVRRAFDSRSVDRPKLGGTLEERVRVQLADGVSLLGISYNRDIEGWRAGFIGLCEATGRKYGIVKEKRLHLSTGEAPLLEELNVTFE